MSDKCTVCGTTEEPLIWAYNNRGEDIRLCPEHLMAYHRNQLTERVRELQLELHTDRRRTKLQNFLVVVFNIAVLAWNLSGISLEDLPIGSLT